MRGQSNAVALKALYLDCDFKDYASPEEAVKELRRFLKEASLPKPNVLVKSGGGLHVYFTFARSLTPAEWQPLANALSEAAKQHNLNADLGCTTDSARVLRVAGTQNRKLEQPRPVELLHITDWDYSVEVLAEGMPHILLN